VFSLTYYSVYQFTSSENIYSRLSKILKTLVFTMFELLLVRNLIQELQRSKPKFLFE